MNGYKKDYQLEKKFHEFHDLKDLLRFCAREYGEKTAFVIKRKKPDGGAAYLKKSYREFYGDFERLGTALLSRAGKGARVAVIGKNSYPWITAYFAASSGVGVTVPLDSGLQREELESCLNRSQATVLFYDRKTSRVAREIASGGKTGVTLYISMDFQDEELPGSLFFDDLLQEGEHLVELGNFSFIDAEIDRDVMSFLLFTSGTTARSKAVMLSHRNLMNCHYGMNCEEYFLPDDVNMFILPLHHIYGFGGLLIFLSQGLTNVFCDGLKYITKNLAEYQVTVFTSVPILLDTIYKKINKAIDEEGKRKQVERAKKLCAAADKVGINLRPKVFREIHNQLGGHLRFIINGASALDPEVSRGLNEFGFLTVQGYGLTETSPTISSETYRYLKPGSCGKFMPNITWKLLDQNEEGIGELCVKADSVMLGYYDDPEATAEALEDGWFHTGDLARVDHEGYVFITGRKKNVIVMKNGKNVFPEEIEDLLNLLPYVSESMVFPRDRGDKDYVLWAKVVVDQGYEQETGATREELEKRLAEDMERINDGMPSYKMVKRWFLSDAPTIKTTTMKTKRREEIKQIEQEIADRGLR